MNINIGGKPLNEWIEEQENKDGERVFFVDGKTGLHHEITPVCVNNKKIGGTKKCEIDPSVVYCCGQCVTTCKNYKKPAQQLDLFSTQTIELGDNIKYHIKK